VGGQFRVAIALYVLDGAASEEVGTAVQTKIVPEKRRASECLSSSPAARAPKRAHVDSSIDHSDGVSIKREGARVCRIWILQLCIARSSPGDVHATGNACVLFGADASVG
jgi:hypothetical protein